jgi:hypothetical protein
MHDPMKRFILATLLSFGYCFAFGQLQFVQRVEVNTKWEDDDFIILNKEDGVVAFRMVSESGLSKDRNLEYFVADHQLRVKGLRQLSVKAFFNLLGFDLDGDWLYVLFQKGDNYSGEKYMVGINLLTDKTVEIPLNAILEMDMQEFFVLEGKAIFMGNMDYRPAIQVFNTSTQHLTTIQGIYEKDLQIIQMRKAPEFVGFDVLMSRRDRFRNKSVTVASFDTEGNKLREVKIDQLGDPNAEIVDGLLTHAYGYNQALIGPYSLKRKNVYQGLYFAQINEFGEYRSHLFNLADFKNFFNYLPEKTKNRRLRSLEKAMEKGKQPPIRNTLATREVISQDGLYLVYNDHFVSSSRRYHPRDGMYINNFYRMSPMVGNPGGLGGYYSPLWSNPYFRSGQVASEYKYLSAQMVLMDENGTIIWEKSLPLDNASRSNPGKFGEVTFDGNNLYYMYLDESELKLSHLQNGEVMVENETYQLELLNENERINETQERSLNLMWWYDNYYLLSGKQKVRFLQEDGKQANKDVYFLTKVRVGD